QHWLRGIWARSSHPSPDEEEVLARTCLAHPLDAFDQTRQQTAALTHAILYASDLGRRPVEWPRTPLEIARDAQTCLVTALDDGDLGMAAEVLWVWPMLRLRWSPVASFAFGLLADSQAMGVLCATVLATGSRPVQTRPRARPTVQHAAHAALERLLDLREAEPAWLPAYFSLDPADRAALAPLLLTSLLRRARRAGDVGRVQELLCLALELGLADLPTVRQSVVSLRRTALVTRTQRGTIGVVGAGRPLRHQN
ncbi:MAG: hypothetical protein ABI083_19865, partial [Lapillicoccus sp.]